MWKHRFRTHVRTYLRAVVFHLRLEVAFARSGVQTFHVLFLRARRRCQRSRSVENEKDINKAKHPLLLRQLYSRREVRNIAKPSLFRRDWIVMWLADGFLLERGGTGAKMQSEYLGHLLLLIDLASSHWRWHYRCCTWSHFLKQVFFVQRSTLLSCLEVSGSSWLCHVMGIFILSLTWRNNISCLWKRHRWFAYHPVNHWLTINTTTNTFSLEWLFRKGTLRNRMQGSGR